MFCFVLFFIPTNRFAGRPGDYVYVFNQYRMEEVNLDICGRVIIYMSNSAVTTITVIDTPVIINYLARGTLLLIICFPFFSFFLSVPLVVVLLSYVFSSASSCWENSSFRTMSSRLVSRKC